MRSIIVLAVASCAASPRTPADERVHQVTCGGVRVPVPASLQVVQMTGSELIAASHELALAVFEDGPARIGGKARVVDQVDEEGQPIYRLAFRDADRCTFRAVARMPASRDASAVIDAIAGTTEPGLLIGGPRAPREPALAVLLREVDGHF
jgi:hypothetical protein